MTFQRKNQIVHWIRQFEREKLTDTSIELFFDRLFPESRKPNPITVVGSDGRVWTFRPDRIIRGRLHDIDGRYHETAIQERKTRWRDLALVENGYRITHISGRLLDGRYDAYVKAEVEKALKSDEPLVRIEA